LYDVKKNMSTGNLEGLAVNSPSTFS